MRCRPATGPLAPGTWTSGVSAGTKSASSAWAPDWPRCPRLDLRRRTDMPGNVNWGKGLGQVAELSILEGWLNAADPTALRTCATALLTDDPDVIVTQAK